MDYPRDPLSSLPKAEEQLSSTAGYLRTLRQVNEGVYVPAASMGSVPGNPNPSSQERRRNPRYKCEGSVEFRSEGSDVRTWATVTDLSRGGCYVEMQATSPTDTPVDMLIEVSDVRVRVKGIVRVSYPFLGMGIVFTEISAEDGARLEDLLLRLAGQASFAGLSKPQGTAAAADLSQVKDASAALTAVAEFFRTSLALTREEFAELLVQSQRGAQNAPR